MPIKDTPADNPSIGVVGAPTRSPTFRKMCRNLTNYGNNNVRFLRSELLKKELILVFLFSKYNIAPSFTTTEIYGRDVVLLS